MQPARPTATRRKGLFIVLSAIVLAAPLIDDALAMRRKPRFTAQVDGKRFKALKRAVFFTYTPTSFSVAGQTRVKRGLSRAISVNCLGDMKTIPVATPVSCYGIYEENLVRGAGGKKDWISLGMELTIQSYEGTRVTGTFRGVLEPSISNPTEPPVTIEAGTFSATVREF